ncbi:carboxypeptidase-like regulatory domain-containing protein [Paludibaculum fermentans]|uniref:Carboxypeptidase regulatory-like domain-containing protein n=1 Tax=Paludibaculum fermentans TaxID=1473598 RepID=A0A7S7NVV3_PALFE|nr:carboxypeptidase-like regulatory domain-containing protein [Paludibaculum fermentans]QOY90134.1 carboxypeptidase regulatory-like domain-containing protein [Paludibaculum fermentans]
MRSVALLLALILAGAAQGQVRPTLPPPSAGNVTLTLDEYNRLLELANKPGKKVDVPPQPYSLQSADLRIEVTGEKAAGKVQLEGQVFTKGSATVPLVSGMTVLEAQQKGKELALVQSGRTHSAVLTGPAEFSISLETGFPLVIEPGRASFQLPAPAAGAVRLTLVLPGDHTNAHVSPGLVTARSSSNGQTTIQATLAPGQNTSVWWASRENVAPVAPKAVRFLSDVKTLVSVGEGQLGLAALIDINVIQGDPAQFEIEMPAGYELAGASGSTLESGAVEGGVLVLKVSNPSARSHQFLVTLEKSTTDTKAEVPFLALKGSQRETGEIVVEGEGTIELTARESGGLKRMDLKEASPYLRALAHSSPHAAFRHHRQPSEPLGLALEWVRFPDKAVIPAVVQDAVVTSMVTSEGRSLTEVRLTLRNQAQPFLRVSLPAGASIVSADVAGQNVKPVQGSDGNRVPLLRPGFRPTGSYPVSFVYMDSGAPFAKKGGAELLLPKMDVPIALLHWEVFLPERYKVANFAGDALRAELLPEAEVSPMMPKRVAMIKEEELVGAGRTQATLSMDIPPGIVNSVHRALNLAPGLVGGVVLDSTTAVIPNAQVVVTEVATGQSRQASANSSGQWRAGPFASGRLKITVSAQGFQPQVRQINYDAERPQPVNVTLNVGSVAETVEVTSQAEVVRDSKRIDNELKKKSAEVLNSASGNVVNLQRRVAGVLTIPVEVPRAGTSFRFVRPLVVDEPTKLSFTYKTK